MNMWTYLIIKLRFHQKHDEKINHSNIDSVDSSKPGDSRDQIDATPAATSPREPIEEAGEQVPDPVEPRDEDNKLTTIRFP